MAVGQSLLVLLFKKKPITEKYRALYGDVWQVDLIAEEDWQHVVDFLEQFLSSSWIILSPIVPQKLELALVPVISKVSLIHSMKRSDLFEGKLQAFEYLPLTLLFGWKAVVNLDTF